MEEKLLKIFKLADELNEKQEKVYAQISYEADNRKILEICIRLKDNFSCCSRCEIRLSNNPEIQLDNVIRLFSYYIGGVSDE